MVHPAITIGDDGELQIDLALLKQSADSSDQDLDAVLARMMIIAYEIGLQVGVNEANEANIRAQVLLHCTGGNA